MPEQHPASTPPGPVTGTRSTRQKHAVATALQQTDQFHSAQDLHARLRTRGTPIGLATVYKQLRALAAAGHIDTIRDEHGETRYRHCATTTTHHHLTCRHCGNTVEIDLPDLEARVDTLAAETGYTDTSHTLEILGTCPTCHPA